MQINNSNRWPSRSRLQIEKKIRFVDDERRYKLLRMMHGESDVVDMTYWKAIPTAMMLQLAFEDPVTIRYSHTLQTKKLYSGMSLDGDKLTTTCISGFGAREIVFSTFDFCVQTRKKYINTVKPSQTDK